MSIKIPQIKCFVSIENFSPNGSIIRKSSISDANLSLCRNRQGDCVLLILDKKTGKEAKRFTLMKNNENYRLNTKFVSEGKSSILFSELNTRLFISNCPPNDLSLFLKGFSLKCNYYNKNKEPNALFLNKTTVNQPKSQVQEISPLTSKDLLKTMAFRDRTNVINKASSSEPVSPVSTTKTINKRKLDMGILSNTIFSLFRKIISFILKF